MTPEGRVLGSDPLDATRVTLSRQLRAILFEAGLVASPELPIYSEPLSPLEMAATRFWPKVDRSAGPDGCWLWLAATNDEGYGIFTIGGKNVRAHRFAYELLVGLIPEGHTLDHVRARGCTHRNCVNPAHLEPVTPGENALRGDGPTARKARQTHCKRGHLLDEANTYIHRGRFRRCRTCTVEYRKQHRDEANARRRARRKVLYDRPAPPTHGAAGSAGRVPARAPIRDTAAGDAFPSSPAATTEDAAP